MSGEKQRAMKLVAMAARMLYNSALLDRARVAQRYGQSYLDSSGTYRRDLYEALGYPTVLEFRDYLARYLRQDVAARVVEAPVEEAWQEPPAIVEDDDPTVETAFEGAWRELNERLSILFALERADKLSGIGQFGVLLLGFADGQLDAPVEPRPSNDLLYVTPYSQGSVSIKKLDTDPRSPRFNLPLVYQVSQSSGSTVDVPGSTVDVHWTRVIHLAEGLLEDEVYGTPRLRPVWNRLEDLERISGGSAEMFWRGAFPGMGFFLDPDAAWDDTDDSEGRSAREVQEDEIREYIHGLKRYLRLQGIKAEQFSPQVADPSKHVDVQLQLISAATRIPKRILVGSERGELASTQDESKWLRFLNRRRKRYLEPRVIRPLIDRLIQMGTLPEPGGGYRIEWPSLKEDSDRDRAEVARVRTEALAKYASTPGVDSVLPVEVFLEDFLGYDEKKIQTIMEMLDGFLNSEEEPPVEGEGD